LRRAHLKPGAEVLDVGIGTGLVAREALKIIGPVAGWWVWIPAPA
jgi:demethylmenaquinone methyltransferase/2-methoxy-6-polyprenyl-1,4-benzoquinol methylase